eukprot:748409_1
MHDQVEIVRKFYQRLHFSTARPSVCDKLLHHPFFGKKNMYDAETVRAKIAHLFQSTELRINAAFSAPISFPNVRQSSGNLKEFMSLQLNDKITPSTQVEEVSTTEEIIDEKKSSVEWNFSPSIRKTKAGGYSFSDGEGPPPSEDPPPSSKQNKERRLSVSDSNAPTTMGRFIVEDHARTSSLSECSAVGYDIIRKVPQQWDCVDCGEWVAALGDAYKPYRKVFVDNGIDGEMLLQLTDELLKEIIPSKLHRAKVISSAKKLFNT